VGEAPLVAQRHQVWPTVGLVGAALAALGGLVLLLRAGDWPTGLSARYEAPAAAATSDDPWRALDRGDDPTITDR
jgi:hypothetical protein